MDGDAEGVLDWDEFNAEGLGFLTDETTPASTRRQKQKTQTLFGSQRPSLSNTSASRTASAPRMYSTSSRSSQPAQEKPNDHARNAASNAPASSLPHLTESGSAHMVSVSAKPHTVRTAIAAGSVYFTNPTPLSLIQSNTLKKGDVLGVSRIAGIMAAKKCPDLIPLCHPIALTHVGVELKPFSSKDDTKSSDAHGYGGVHIEAKVQCTGPTGVEMEALTAVMGAALSIVDMCKAVDKFQRVQDVRVVLKEGGKSGVWREEGWASWQGE